MKKSAKIVLMFIMIFIIINNIIFASSNILSWDVFGYYLYLPLKFIYNNLSLHNDSIITTILEKYHNSGTFYQAMKMDDGGYVMKYTMGLSFFYFPFFWIGHTIAKISGYPADGFSLPYQYSICAGGIIYSIIGIWALAKVLSRFFAGKIVAIVLIIIVFSTNYIINITMYGQNAVSHNYLFTTYALILYLTILWHDTHKMKHSIFLAVLCGLTILSRPSEVVCLIIPALWSITDKNTAVEKINLLLKNIKQVILFIIILILIGSVQFIYWKIHTGKFFYNSYGGNAGEGFEFFSPYISEVLFSFRKGWLIYTPVMFFAIAGFIFSYKKNRLIFYPLFIYFIVNLYIVSSWSCWWYAQCFSQRALIPSYPVMAILLGYFLVWLNEQKKIPKTTGYILIIACICLNIFQSKQFYFGVISGDRMTKDYYFAVFGKMYVTEADKEKLLVKRSFDGNEIFENEEKYSSHILKKLDFESSGDRDSAFANSGKYSFKLDSNVIYSPNIEAPYYELTAKDHAWLRVSAYVYPVTDIINNPFSLIITFEHKGFSYKYSGLDSKNMKLELNKWNKISVDYITPEVRRKSDNLKIYFWHRGKYPVYIDDLQAEIFEKKY